LTCHDDKERDHLIPGLNQHLSTLNATHASVGGDPRNLRRRERRKQLVSRRGKGRFQTYGSIAHSVLSLFSQRSEPLKSACNQPRQLSAALFAVYRNPACTNFR
jgi:hypothetical protein